MIAMSFNRISRPYWLIAALWPALSLSVPSSAASIISNIKITPRIYTNANKPAPLNSKNGEFSFKTSLKSGTWILTSYGTGSTDDRDCTELVRRYAFLLGFYGPAVLKNDSAKSLLSLGDGKSAAKGFAARASQQFTYYSAPSATLPKPGSVVSIDYFKGATTGKTITGHVGIIDSYSVSATATKFTVRIFDQNSPGDYKNLTFSKVGGKWSATWPNGGKAVPVVGWASPKN